jgi:threonyl-tRNA synthetase
MMNCPGHVQIFKQGLRSYRDLPLRFAEFGKVRYEPSRCWFDARAASPGRRAHLITGMTSRTTIRGIDLLLSIYRDWLRRRKVKFSDRPRRAAAAGVGSGQASSKAHQSEPIEYPNREGALCRRSSSSSSDAIGRDWQVRTRRVI